MHFDSLESDKRKNPNTHLMDEHTMKDKQISVRGIPVAKCQHGKDMTNNEERKIEYGWCKFEKKQQRFRNNLHIVVFAW